MRAAAAVMVLRVARHCHSALGAPRRWHLLGGTSQRRYCSAARCASKMES
jgi:hypothetical protein